MPFTHIQHVLRHAHTHSPTIYVGIRQIPIRHSALYREAIFFRASSFSGNNHSETHAHTVNEATHAQPASKAVERNPRLLCSSCVSSAELSLGAGQIVRQKKHGPGAAGSHFSVAAGKPFIHPSSHSLTYTRPSPCLSANQPTTRNEPASQPATTKINRRVPTPTTYTWSQGPLRCGWPSCLQRATSPVCRGISSARRACQS
mmetsp:Transcript_53206/g.133951  ORF Transcript_53206/g.133951 Transcript_53206/m.133951 type:complete len:202 (-) Transcript_53206:1128-1733(-)